MNSIEDQFNRIASQYDEGRKKFIPCFDDYYERTTALIASNIEPPKRVVDLGAGTGLLTKFYLPYFPDAEFLLVDVAAEMLEIARTRFAKSRRIQFQQMDYAAKLPESDFDLAISALSIHHLEDARKSKLFQELYRRLPAGGRLINYDQFCAESPEVDQWINSHWEKHLYRSGLGAEEIAMWMQRRKLDRECSIGTGINLLREAGFSGVECVYHCLKFAVIAGVK
ncbi:MAG: class I SAM-dependent methyltransferase [Victivallaceae bacterium]|nr:class I SAM-dependent methyltransferase [Victivallaceae bacterium]